MAHRQPRLWRPWFAAMLAAMTLLAVACASRADGPAETAPAKAGLLKITQVTVGDAIPIEGALSYIRIKSTGATVTRQLPASHQVTLRMAPGAYQLMSWQRTCDRNCGYLDPPSNRCARSFTLRSQEHLGVAIRVNFDSECVIVLHRSP